MKGEKLEFNEHAYESLVEEMFERHQSVLAAGFNQDAYKPGLERMLEFDRELGFPSKKFKSIHVAGTNGKGSVCSMLASVLASTGKRVGLYTSPHLFDFRERVKIISDGCALIPKKDVFQFLSTWMPTFDRLGLSFFEITTGLAFWWFAKEEIDCAVIEVGLGGLLDSTNIITPEVAVVSSIGLDHCALLGSTRAEIAGQKAGIFKTGVPAVVGVRDSETAPVFDSCAEKVACPLYYASDAGFSAEDILNRMDLRGEYQRFNLRTVLKVMEILGIDLNGDTRPALEHTAARTGLNGRWEQKYLPDGGKMVSDIGHNPPALKENFTQLKSEMDSGGYSDLFVLYGVMADKALDDIIPLMPGDGSNWKVHYIFVTPSTSRAMDSGKILEHFRALGRQEDARAFDSVAAGLEAIRQAGTSKPYIYVGGSTFVVSELKPGHWLPSCTVNSIMSE